MAWAVPNSLNAGKLPESSAHGAGVNFPSLSSSTHYKPQQENTMKITTAIKQARETIGTLAPFGDGFIYLTYAKHGTYQSTPADYWQAMASRSQALINECMFAMGREPVQYNGGRWTDYI